jgi:hypothetical protein
MAPRGRGIYIQMTPGEREPRSFTPDESRRARGLPLYGQVAMRISISNWSTTAEDIDRSAAAIISALDSTEPHSPSLLNDSDRLA